MSREKDFGRGSYETGTKGNIVIVVEVRVLANVPRQSRRLSYRY
jgi:hypothetical protein